MFLALCVGFFLGLANASKGIFMHGTGNCTGPALPVPLFTGVCVPFGAIYAEATCNTGGAWEVTPYSNANCTVAEPFTFSGANASSCSPINATLSFTVNCTADPYAGGPTKISVWLAPNCSGAPLLATSAGPTCAALQQVFNFNVPGALEATCDTSSPNATATLYNDLGCLELNNTASLPKGVCVPLPFSFSPGVNPYVMVTCGSGCGVPYACNYTQGLDINVPSMCDYTCTGCGNITACNYNNALNQTCYFKGDKECGACGLRPTFGLFMLLLILAFFK